MPCQDFAELVEEVGAAQVAAELGFSVQAVSPRAKRIRERQAG